MPYNARLWSRQRLGANRMSPMVTAQYQLVKLDNLRIASDHEAEVYSPPWMGKQPSDRTNYPETFSRSDRGTRVQAEAASL